ncbi:MAG: hypothetical protein WBL35_12075 [Ornithinibacter sp.]
MDRERPALGRLVEGGGAVSTGLTPAAAYTIGEIVNLLAVRAPAFAIGAMALVIAARCPRPGWLRVLTVVGGLGGLTAPLFVTYFVFLLWALAFGCWLGLRTSQAPAELSLEAAPSIV